MHEAKIPPTSIFILLSFHSSQFISSTCERVNKQCEAICKSSKLIPSRRDENVSEIISLTLIRPLMFFLALDLYVWVYCLIDDFPDYLNPFLESETFFSIDLNHSYYLCCWINNKHKYFLRTSFLSNAVVVLYHLVLPFPSSSPSHLSHFLLDIVQHHLLCGIYMSSINKLLN